MEKSTTELTVEYIKEHPHVKNCLKKGLINYSSLARLIAKDLNIEKKSSMEAILIAARRYNEKLVKEFSEEKNVKKIISNSEIEIMNKIKVIILKKNIDFDYIDDIQKKIRKDSGTFFLIEGSNSYTTIISEKNSNLIEDSFKSKIIKVNKKLVMLKIKSPLEIETTPGVISYLTSLFAENGVNVYEFYSCWTDTIFIISSNELNKVINFLNI